MLGRSLGLGAERATVRGSLMALGVGKRN